MSGAIVPVAKVDVRVRVATLADVPFMDALQKRHGKALGFMSTKQLEGYVEMGAVLIAVTGHSSLVTRGETPEAKGPASDEGQVTNDTPLGYIIHRDRYLKRDELGVIFQLCVAEGEQRKLVGATLVLEAFARSAYGCRLYCLWCAQDLDANCFWESLGFVPIAFRTGSARKRRVHIFWQKRIREGDSETPWWYPCQTSGGAIGDDRLVFPIPPGKHWRDEMPVIIPVPSAVEGPKTPTATGQLPGVKDKAKGPRLPKDAPSPNGPAKHGPRQYGGPGAKPVAAVAPVVDTNSRACPERSRRERKPKVKCDPKHLALAREFRDRWSELPDSQKVLTDGAAKYDVTRMLPTTTNAPAMRALPAAA